jgi:cold shock CspA family protein
MRLSGILRSWNDERGFGFIAPTHGGAELFVHISALPRDGSRPVTGESVTYELGRGANGRPQAINVIRVAVGTRAPSPPAWRPPRPARRTGRTTRFKVPVATMLVIAAMAYGYDRFARRAPVSSPPLTAPVIDTPRASQGTFRCDGRTYCSQMSSCEEATYFLRNCPGVKMDGDNDGVPCEEQWCR